MFVQCHFQFVTLKHKKWLLIVIFCIFALLNFCAPMGPIGIIYNPAKICLESRTGEGKSRRKKCPNTEFFLVRIFPYLD